MQRVTKVKKPTVDPAVITPNQQVTTIGIRQGFERLQIQMTEEEAQRIILDIRGAMYGKFEISYKDLIDYMTKRRVNISMGDKGFVDPLLASSVSAMNKIKDFYNLTIEKVFGYLSTQMANHSATTKSSSKTEAPILRIGKEQFVQCL